MLNEHTLKIKQFFRKLIITNKCNVKKLNIWLFGLYIMRIFSDGNYLWCFCEEKYLDFADFCLVTCLIWLVIAKTTNILKIFWFLPKSPFFPLNLLRFDVACYYAEIPLDPKYDYDEQVKYSFLQEFLANWKKGKEILCVK